MARLLLVRHGDTKSNSREKFWGKTDVELSAAGIEQAERLRDRLAAEKIDAIYTSSLQRASVTAEIIAARHQVAVTACAELCEIDFGEIEGRAFTEPGPLYPGLTKPWLSRAPDL